MTSPPSFHFGTAHCNPEIEEAVLWHLVRDETHPSASRQFGSHFLAFPLLQVNQYLRRRVARFLYKLVFETKHVGVPGASSDREGPHRMIFAPSLICHQDGLREKDNCRFILKQMKQDSLWAVRTTHAFTPNGLDDQSATLFVTFDDESITKSFRPYGKATQIWRIPLYYPRRWDTVVGDADTEGEEEDRGGEEHPEWPMFIQLISTAWFEGEHTGGAGSDEVDEGVPASIGSAIDRFGFKPTVPLPLNDDGKSYDIGIPPHFHPEWTTPASPESKYHDETLHETEWRIKYETHSDSIEDGDEESEELNAMMLSDLNNYPDVDDEDDDERTPEDYDDIYCGCLLKIRTMRVPLLDLLRPPVVSECPYDD